MGIRTELHLRLPNSPGATAGICRLLADERVNILALSLANGHLRLVVDNPVRASGALASARHHASEHEVLYVSVANRPGGLLQVLQAIADAGVNVEYAYGGGGSADATVVIGVDDAVRAATLTGL